MGIQKEGMQILLGQIDSDRLQEFCQVAEIFNGKRQDNSLADIGELCQTPEAVGAGDKDGPCDFAFAVCDRVRGMNEGYINRRR